MIFTLLKSLSELGSPGKMYLTHWGRVTHTCVSKLTIIGSENGLSPGRRQAIIWTNAGILFIGPSGTNFNEMLIEILTFSFMKMCLKGSSAKWRPFCLGLNVLKCTLTVVIAAFTKTPEWTVWPFGGTIPSYNGINSSPPGQNGRHFPDDIFKCIFLDENAWISIKISLKFVPKDPINNIPALVQQWLGTDQATSHYLNQWWLGYWLIYASLVLNELTVGQCRP